jgi:hypothetical protein
MASEKFARSASGYRARIAAGSRGSSADGRGAVGADPLASPTSLVSGPEDLRVAAPSAAVASAREAPSDPVSRLGPEALGESSMDVARTVAPNDAAQIRIAVLRLIVGPILEPGALG